MKTVEELIFELQTFTNKGMFVFKKSDVLSSVCNIPKKSDLSGLYLFYDNNDELIYIGISGRTGINEEIIHRQDGLRGRFLTGKQFGDRRSKSLPIQMDKEEITELKIYWFITYCENSFKLPRPIEKLLIQTFKEENDGKRPKWNKRD